MGYRSVRKAFGDYNAFVFYLDDGAVDLPIIKDRTSIMPGSEAHDLKTLDMWVLNSDFLWEYCPWKNGNIGGGSAGEVTKNYVDSQDKAYYQTVINYIQENGAINIVDSLPTSGAKENIIYGMVNSAGLSLYVYNNGWHTVYSNLLSIDGWISKHTGTTADYPYTKAEVQNLIACMKNILVVATEPTSPMKNTIYYIGPKADDSYDVILYDSMLARIDLGSSSLNFSDYQKTFDAELSTTSKQIVGAINEVAQSAANCQVKEPAAGTLKTTSTTIVDAINEVFDSPAIRPYADLGGKTIIAAIQELSSASFSSAYPIGSIFLSMGVNPNTLGGTWERISNAFLFGNTEGSYPGTTGGQKEITLTTAELPAHTHDITITNNGEHSHAYYGHGTNVQITSGTSNYVPTDAKSLFDTGSSGSHTHTANATSVGEGKAINIMPPYITVDIWKRTA